MISMPSIYGRQPAAAIKQGFTKLNSDLADDARLRATAGNEKGGIVKSFMAGGLARDAGRVGWTQEAFRYQPLTPCQPNPKSFAVINPGCIPIQIDQHVTIDAGRGEVEQRFAISVERPRDQARTKAPAQGLLHRRPAGLSPDEGQLSGSADLPDIPNDFDKAAIRTQRTIFHCVGGEFMNDQVQRERQSRVEAYIGPAKDRSG